jgi:hypothetical protein
MEREMTKAMIAFLIVFASVSIADDSPPAQVKRLSSVTWDPQIGKLSWVVQSGTEGTAGFEPSSEEHYEFAPKEGIMTSGGEKREFTDQQGTGLADLLHALSTYCVASTIWWYRGETPPAPDGKPTTSPPSKPEAPKPAENPDTAPHKVTQPRNMKMPLLRPLAQPLVP